MIFGFNKNKIFILDRRNYEHLNLYDFTDLNEINYQNIKLEEVINPNKLFDHKTIIGKFSDDKILFTKKNYIFIIKY